MSEEKDKKNEPPKHLWDRFIMLGERIGDGDLDANESKWMNREYLSLAKQLDPEIKESFKKKRQEKALRINEQMAKLLADKKCSCGGEMEQSRSGSIICYCKVCNKRFKATSKKKNG